MIRTNSFYDLCVNQAAVTLDHVEETIKRLYEFGYRTIAINQTIEDEPVESKKKRRKGEPAGNVNDIVPVPYSLDKIEELVKTLDLRNFKVFNRLTVVFSTQDNLHKITKSPNYKKYHILAACPSTYNALMFTCRDFEADIITFNPENKFNLRLNRKIYNQLVARGYHLEILYSPAIKDSTMRKNLINAAHIFHSAGKSKNIIISSGAEKPILIRSPYDVISLGFIFGLGELKSKSAVSHSCYEVIANSVGRINGKSVMYVETVQKEDEEEDSESSEDDMEVDQPAQKKSKS